MRFLHLAVISVLLFLTGCNAAADHVSAEEISSPTPFQPLTNSASDTPASDSAPTPVDLPTLAPLLPTPTPFLILPQYIPADAMVPAFTVTSTLNPLTGLPPVDPALLQRRPMAIKGQLRRNGVRLGAKDRRSGQQGESEQQGFGHLKAGFEQSICKNTLEFADCSASAPIYGITLPIHCYTLHHGVFSITVFHKPS